MNVYFRRKPTDHSRTHTYKTL